MERRSLTGIAVLVIGLAALAPTATVAQETAPPDMGLASRLPATIDGAPVLVTSSEDLQTWLDTKYPGESHPEIEALEAALAPQGLSLADVATVTAYFGLDFDGQIQGFAIPGTDAASLVDAVTAATLIGSGQMQRTERDIGDHTVTFLSEGPLDAADYPFAVMPDTDVLWILNAETVRITEALEALLAVAAGSAPGYTGIEPEPQPVAEIGPAAWVGTMSGTTKWTKGAYVGEGTATFRGTLERLESEDRSYCSWSGPCVAYLPKGEVEWSWDAKAPGPPSCDIRKTGVVPTGDVVTPHDQMMFMAPAGTDHLVYWGSGYARLPQQDCVGWESAMSQGQFFYIPTPSEDDFYADVVNEPRPGCQQLDWRIKADATELKGTCWGYDESGYEEWYDWDLTAVDPE